MTKIPPPKKPDPITMPASKEQIGKKSAGKKPAVSKAKKAAKPASKPTTKPTNNKPTSSKPNSKITAPADEIDDEGAIASPPPASPPPAGPAGPPNKTPPDDAPDIHPSGGPKNIATKADNLPATEANPSDETEDLDASRAPITSHLAELRRRLLWSLAALFIGFVICFAFAQDIYNFLAAPLTEAWGQDSGRRMIYTALHEQFFTQVKVAFFAALCIGFPIISSQIWMFVAPGLYRDEKRAFLPFLIATPILFIAGAAFVYYFVMPVAINFFLGFEQMASPTTIGADGQISSTPTIQLEAKVSEYLSLIMQLIFAFGLCFELPVLLTLLCRVGLVSVAGLKAKRRYAIVAAFVAAAILTPPDPLSQIGLALPIIFLYEISIWTSVFLEKKRDNQDKTT